MKLLADGRLSRFVGVLLIIVHVLLYFRIFSPSLYIHDQVPLRIDTSRYFASLVSADSVGGLHGYDPYQMAGYPAGLWNSMGKKGYELGRFVFPGLSLERVFYATLFAAGCILPLLISAWLAYLLPVKRLLLFGLLLLYWHLETFVCYFWQVGNVFFPLGSLLLICLIVQVGRLCLGEEESGKGEAARGKWGAGVGAALLATFLFYTHTVLLVPGIITTGLLASLALYKRKFEVRRWLLCVVSAAICIVLSLPWLVPLLANRGISQPEPWSMFSGGLKHLVMDLFSDRVYRHHFDRQLLYHIALGFGLVGGWLVLRGRASCIRLRFVTARHGDAATEAGYDRLSFVLVGAIVCLFITYVLPVLGVFTQIQPYRFRLTGVLFLVPLAAFTLEKIGAWIRKSDWQSRGWFTLLCVVLLPAFSGYVLDMTYRQEYQTSRSFESVFRAFDALPGDGRLLIENIPLGHLTPHYTGRPILGGLSTQAFVKHGFAGIDDRKVVFGKPAAEWEVESFCEMLDLYAVQYVVCETEALERLMQPDYFDFVKSVKGQKIYAFKPYTGYVLIGSRKTLHREDAKNAKREGVQVIFDYNMIHVTGVGTNEVVLKFHWDERLQSDDPNVVLEPVKIEGIPVPFVRWRRRAEG